ncbi:hypothetical protein Nepgr_016623 [Nepenthes gracilis]|uniref:Pentatricopeptide repeat-containing protein n=1 Tax=Nepenthes gracilis TaxID=150966 RepID=A0AAD3SPM5_NEPGR|nr:hypothetical protein Nepgr_016623 [Nepenthes gracilis]
MVLNNRSTLHSLGSLSKSLLFLSPYFLTFSLPSHLLSLRYHASLHCQPHPEAIKFRSLLKLCKTIEDLKPFQALIIVNGLIDDEIFIGNFIRRCFELGNPEFALSAFQTYGKCSLFLQNLIIRNLCKCGFYKEILSVYRKCRLVGCPSDDYTFPSVIKACSALCDVEVGKGVHSLVLRTGYYRNVVVQTALVDYYAKIGRTDIARLVLDRMSQPDLVSWNALISGYSWNFCDNEALEVLRQIWVKGLKPNVSTLASIIPVCTRLGCLNMGKHLHGYAIKCGFFQNELLTPALISMYAHTGDIVAGRRLFDLSPIKNIVIWNSMIYAYTQNQRSYDAYEMFSDMLHSDFCPNTVTFVSIIPCCEDLDSIWHGECLHACVVKHALEKQASVATALISMYANLGYLDSAKFLFDQIAGFVPDAISIISVLTACCNLEAVLLGKSAHAFSIKKDLNSNLNLSNLLLAFYSDCHQVSSSYKLFQKMVVQNTISWNTMISGYLNNGEIQKAVALLLEMQLEGVEFDLVTLISILPYCYKRGDLVQGMAVHCYAVKSGFINDVFFCNSLINTYSNCGNLGAATLLFEIMPQRSVISWNSLITSYLCHNLHSEVMVLLRQMAGGDQRPNYITLLNTLPSCYTILQGKSIHAFAIRTGAIEQTPLVTSIIFMYARFERMASCFLMFGAGEKQHTSLWNAMMSALVPAREAKNTVAIFCQLLWTELKPDYITILSLVSACVQLNSISLNDSIVAYLTKGGFVKDAAICNALIDNYAKCGYILIARKLFEELQDKDAVSWSVMINGYTLHGDGNAAVALLLDMEDSSVRPDSITYLSILSACSHGGLVEQSKMVLNSMIVHEIRPSIEHYACILDLLGRTGYLNEAYDIVNRLPGGPSVSMLESLLGACMVHGNLELGMKICGLLLEREPENPGFFVMLHNMYASAGRWNDANKVRDQMENRGLKKVPGFSLLTEPHC